MHGAHGAIHSRGCPRTRSPRGVGFREPEPVAAGPRRACWGGWSAGDVPRRQAQKPCKELENVVTGVGDSGKSYKLAGCSVEITRAKELLVFDLKDKVA